MDQIEPATFREIEKSLLAFAENIAVRNPKLSSRELNHAVRATMDLAIEDKPPSEVITGLYRSDASHEFSALPEILGQVYEQLLGKEIRLAPGRQVEIEDKPHLKKAGGAFYTPTDIIGYIVNHTVGKLLDGQNPDQAAKLTILDPACGAGSFLLQAYQRLLDWHRDWYVADGARNYKRELYHTQNGWRLTTAEKQRILLNCIYGVDIDRGAIQVTTLSLLLKMLEGESRHAFPDLAGNIKCGNSLIGPDFYDNEEYREFDETGRTPIHAFDWDSAFQRILRSGGFAAVIGNPPWGQKVVDAAPAEKRYLWKKYPSTRGIYDIYRPFVELCTRLLTDGGMFGLVLPDIVLLKNYAETRRHLLEQLALERIDWWGMAFPTAAIDAVTIVGAKRSAQNDHCVQACVRDPEHPVNHKIPQAEFWANPRFTFNLHLTPQTRKFLELLASCPKLGTFFEVHEGVHSGNIRTELFVSHKIDEACRELYFGRGEIAAYLLQWQGKFIHLAAVPKTRSRQRYANIGKTAWHEREKVLVRRTGDHVLAAFDPAGRYASNNFFLVFPRQPYLLDLHGLCALLNSRLMTWYFRAIEPRQGRIFAELKIKHLTTFPLPSAILHPQGCNALNKLGAERASIAAKLAGALRPQVSAQLRRKATRLDAAIEAQVRDLFGLPDDFHGIFAEGDDVQVTARPGARTNKIAERA
jgi:hypothetical protein